MASFKKKVVAFERIAEVESVASVAPIIGDPRLGSSPLELIATHMPELTVGSTKKVGSSQDVSGGYQVGGVYEVEVGQIKSNPFNPRAVYTSSAVNDMAQSMSNNGQRVSATAYVNDHGEVVLIEGETRLRGARAAGLPTLRVEIRPRPASDRELYEEARAANVERRDQSPLDDAIKWKELIEKKIYPTQVALAKALNLGEDHVSRTMSLANLPHRIIHSVAENTELLNHKMLNAIREYWAVKGDEDTLELILEVAKTGMGYRDVVARRKSAVKGPVKRPRSKIEKLTFRGAKGEFKSFEEGGRIQLVLNGLSVDAAEEIGEKIKALFSKD
ncbi:MAG: ParB/RepB/Spo0J family partition protein [Ottowia sp.]|nr:ParB/RepB/Spo0J family partition protein [Ottowia sp.]